MIRFSRTHRRTLFVFTFIGCMALYFKLYSTDFLSMHLSDMDLPVTHSVNTSYTLNKDHFNTEEWKQMVYSNPSLDVFPFTLRLMFSPEEQRSVAVSTRDFGDAKMFILDRKIWTEKERYSMKWINRDIMGMQNITFSKMFKSPCWFDVHSTLRCLPYFYIIGAPKCGTTDLYQRLIRHPDVIKPTTKEMHWLTRSRIGGCINCKHNTTKSFLDYLSYFVKLSLRLYKYKREGNGSSTEITGDFSASTLWDNRIWTELPRNDNPLEPTYTNADYVYKLNPNTKIIALIRDPAARLYSDYLYFLKERIGEPRAQFHDHVVKAIRLFTRCMQLISLRSCVYNRVLHDGLKIRLSIGIYFIHLLEWYRRFPSNQILVINSGEFSKNVTKVVGAVFKFLGLGSLDEELFESIVETKRANVRSSTNTNVGQMWPETRHLLNSFYSPFNEQLSLLLKTNIFKDMASF